MIAETLQKIVESTPGSVGAVFVDGEGIIIGQHMSGLGELDIESIAMELSARFEPLRNAATSLELGGINELTIRTDEATLIVRFINEYFLVLVLKPSGLAGKGRYKLRSSASSFREVI
ncbi:MAG: roadblock/LC7 domain-containing protein [Myxococcales bacterium]|nr:roadblock/LC7 domain-containing protein [Myxococcales bacterium]